MSESVQKMKREYQTVGVLAPDLDDATLMGAIDKLRKVVTGNGGKLVKAAHTGRKKLAYGIEGHAKGIFVNFHYVSDAKLPAELERNLRLMDSVIRFQTHKVAVNVLDSAYEAETEDAYMTALQTAMSQADLEDEPIALPLPSPSGRDDDDDDDFIESQMEPVDDGSDSN